MSLSDIYNFLIDPGLPAKVLLATGAIATLIVVVGVGVWGILGAVKAFRYLVRCGS